MNKNLKYGNFSEDGNEYVLTDMHPPRDWFNYLWNEHTLVSVSQKLTGNSLYQNDDGIVTNLFGQQDELHTPRSVYLRDRESGEFWSAGFQPCGTEVADFSCHHGLGYTIVSGQHKGLRSSCRIFVPCGEAAEVWTLTVTNESSQARLLSLFSVADIKLTGAAFPYGYISSLRAQNVDEDGLLLFRNTSYNVVKEKYSAVMFSTRQYDRWDVSREHFLGALRNPIRPQRVVEGQLSNSVASVELLVGAMQHDLELAPSESCTFHIILGTVQDLKEGRALKNRLGSDAAVEAAFERLKQKTHQQTAGLCIETPDGDFNQLFNVWLKQQLHLMADWARFYFKGYRDTCQDAAGMSILNAKRAMAMLKKALQNQRHDGYCPRAFRVSGKEVGGADKQYSDSASWISHATDAILRETGDLSFLEERVAYSDQGEGSVWQHNLRAMEFLWNDRSPRGLSLIHDGDWCDLLDKVGPEGRGESVWMSLALARVLKLVASMAEWKGDSETAQTCQTRFLELQKAIFEHGWDGDYFLVAINDAGEPIGTAQAEEGKVFINPQSWAMLSGVIDANAYTGIAEKIEPLVDTPVGPVHNWPPFTQYQEGIGQLSGTPPGFFTNGNVYCHAASFKVAADYEAGRSDKAFDTLMRILPAADRSEPYAQANGYVGPTAMRHTHHVSDDPWRTGTVAWNFLNLSDRLLGFCRSYEGVTFRPQLPSCWESLRYTRPFRGTTFSVEVRKGPRSQLYVNGELQDSDFLRVGSGGLPQKHVDILCIQR
ncbi:MAG: hypothetical protein JJU20_14880 [Opitutales bacterium]|nr:hypothetical protein [Opitutales bacterium]